MSNDTKKQTAVPVASARAKSYDHGPNLATKKLVARPHNGDLPTFKGQASSIVRNVEAHRPGVSSTNAPPQNRAANPSAGVQDSELTKKHSNRTPIEDRPAPRNDSVYEFDRPKEQSCCVIL